MITKAHYDSKKFILDPAYSIHGKNPEDPFLPSAPFWHYGHYEYETFVLERMVRQKNEAKLKVGYTSYRHIPEKDAYFSISSIVGGTIEFRATGRVEALFDGKVIFLAEPSERTHVLTLDHPGKLVIHLHCDDVEKDVPALLPLNVIDGWRYSPDGQNESEPVCRLRREDGLPPHQAETPLVPLTAVNVSPNVWDAGRELFCFVDIECSDNTPPDLYVGESVPEMENENAADEEQTRELVQTAPHCWTSKVPLALRYIRIEHARNPRVSLRAYFHPAEYLGAFAVPAMDDMTKIWMHSAYTLHLCMHHFLLDGVKRDRLPWAGDLAVSLLGNAYSFGDGTIVRDSLSVLGAVSAKTAHINTIVDYTLWWIINHELYQKYFRDPAFLKLEYPRIMENVDYLLSQRDENGFLTAKRENDWLFIDWVPGEKITAVQILFVRALRAAASLADRMGENGKADSFRKTADELAATIRRLTYDPERRLFAAAPGKKEFTRHANLLAVDFGIAGREESEFIAKELSAKDLPPVGTPYMSIFEAMAIAKSGDVDAALAKISEIWGGMLALGATSFFEGFDPAHSGSEHYVFYGRPFGGSLCHAWGSGPLFLLPKILFGLEPAADGWKEFRLKPVKGLTASFSVPTPSGLIEGEIEDGEVVRFSAPADCKRV